MSLKTDIANTGKFPPVELRVKPVWAVPAPALPVMRVADFLTYEYDTSVLVPADTFSFSWAAPESKKIWSDYFREGDICQLFANTRTMATGLIDGVEVEVNGETGESISARGRDLMGQLEDQDAVNLDSTIIFGRQMTVQQVFSKLQQNTRIPGLRLQDAPTGSYLFATEPQESKLSALQRYLEPLNCIAWMDPDGTMVIGRPNMAQIPKGRFILDHTTRYSNCLGMRASFASATIPNMIIPVWAGQETVQNRVAKQQLLLNAAEGPARLLQSGHRLAKCIVVSNPDGGSAQDQSKVNAITAANAGNANLLQGYGKRELARRNVNEVIVQVTMPGHYDENGDPFRTDTTWTITFPKALKQSLEMYCYQAKFTLKPGEGQRSHLFFCKKGTIVSDVKVS